MWFPFNKDEAFGMPRNTVRAALTFFFAYHWVSFIRDGVDYPPEFLMAVVGLLTIYYGDKVVQAIRNGNGTTKEIIREVQVKVKDKEEDS